MSLANVQVDTYADFHGLAELRAKAGGNKASEQEALNEAARQFESIFMKMMLKSMRDTVPESDLINNDKTRFYQSMYDDQISLDLTKRGNVGLANMIVQQLGGVNQAGGDIKANIKTIDDYRAVSAFHTQKQRINGLVSKPTSDIKSPEQFIDSLWPQAKAAAEELGVNPKVLLAQSALETGWGKHVMSDRNGQSSHNLFGIKASRGWQGKTVSVQTVEYENGIAVKKQASFRAYDNYQESFNDYVQFLKQNPRYQQALSNVDSNERFVKGLQKAGYATDPAYAKKIISILNNEHLSSLNSGALATGSEKAA